MTGIVAEEFWIFAYGSLMWDPGFPFEESAPALLRGWHRSFCLLSTSYRGSQEKPGLVLGLDRGGACRGLAYRVAAERREEVCAYLKERETPREVYFIRAVEVALSRRRVKAHTFVVNRGFATYAGKLTPEATARYIVQGVGNRGTCRDYLANTVAHLDQLGIGDGPLHRLLRRVEEICAEDAAAVAAPGGHKL